MTRVLFLLMMVLLTIASNAQTVDGIDYQKQGNLQLVQMTVTEFRNMQGKVTQVSAGMADGFDSQRRAGQVCEFKDSTGAVQKWSSRVDPVNFMLRYNWEILHVVKLPAQAAGMGKTAFQWEYTFVKARQQTR